MIAPLRKEQVRDYINLSYLCAVSSDLALADIAFWSLNQESRSQYHLQQ